MILLLWPSLITLFDFKVPYLFDKPPWVLIKFLDHDSGHLLETGRLLNFHHFQQVKYVYFVTKQ